MYRLIVDIVASLFFATFGYGIAKEIGTVGFISGFFFGFFLMTFLRLVRRNLILKNLEILREKPELIEELRRVLPDDR
jgi:hypothetical protein